MILWAGSVSFAGQSNASAPCADLPPLLKFQDGRKVTKAEEWDQRRREIRDLMMAVFIGTVPDETPTVLEVEVVREEKTEDGWIRRDVKVTLDTPGKLSFPMQVWIPVGEGPFPLLLTAPRFYQMGWAEEAIRRGYMVCLYPGVDSHHEEEAYPEYQTVWEGFRKAYPQASWGEIAVKAWLAGRTLDVLLDPKYGYPVANGQVGIIGFSRYGKQSLVAAALDDRITCVVARSSGAGGSAPYRFNGREGFGEACCDFAGQWFLESLRGYAGRENELPIDSHGWLGLIAPRHCLLDTAYTDDGDPTFAVERGYLEGCQVYRLLGYGERLRVDYRPGGHQTLPYKTYIAPERYRRNLDWFDLAFGRGNIKQEDFPERLIHHFDWEAWKRLQRNEDLETPDVSGCNSEAESIRKRMVWMLGEKPERIEGEGQTRFFTDEEDEQMGHDRWQAKGTARVRVSFGAGVPGNLYFNPELKEPLAAVIWLHPFSYGTGYNEGYGVEENVSVYHALAKEGYAVLAYDQCGFGLRLLEGRDFYQHYPRWSKLGRMVYDVHCAVDFLDQGHGQAQGQIPGVRGKRIYLLGYGLGGMVALHAAALDRRIAGVASFCGFTPWQTDTDARMTGGIRRWWQWHAITPKLGIFHGRETEIPYNYTEVLSLVAPRSCLIIAPKRDRHANAADVLACAAAAKTYWDQAGAAERLVVSSPDDINRFQADQRIEFLTWLERERR